MKNAVKLIFSVVALTVGCVGLGLAAEHDLDPAAAMEEWAKYAAPDGHHEFLAKLEGTWIAESKMWMQPGAPPMESSGVANNEMLLGGRFLMSEYKAEMMGQPFTGMAIDGYDRLRKKYTGVWLDSMGTMMMIFEGDVDATGKVRTMISEYDDPMTGQKSKMKGVTTILSERQHKYEGYNLGPDGEFLKHMEVVYTRK